MDELRLQLASLLIVNLVLGNVLELGGPWLQAITTRLKAKCCAARSRVGVELSRRPDQVELQDEVQQRAREQGMGALTAAERRDLDDARIVGEFERPRLKALTHGLNATFYEYNELVIQYGYIVMFSPALPGVALLALLNNLVEIRSDAHKLLRLSRRCHALPISPFVGIGAWRRIITLLTCAGIVTNVLLLVYTTDLFDRLDARGWPQLAIAFIAEHILMALKLLTDWLVPDVPSKVWEEEARWQWMEALRKRRLVGRAADGGDPSPPIM